MPAQAGGFNHPLTQRSPHLFPGHLEEEPHALLHHRPFTCPSPILQGPRVHSLIKIYLAFPLVNFRRFADGVSVLKRMLVRQLNRLPPKTRSIVLTLVLGLVAGLTGVILHLFIEGLFKLGIENLAENTDFWTLAWGSFVIITVTSLISGWLMYSYCPEAAGSGIPQLKLAYWKDFGQIDIRAVIVKFFAGVLAVGGGASLGREGPTVYMAGGLASHVAGELGTAKQHRRRAAAAGAAAGLAAAFNTPLAAITFVIEEVMEDFNGRVLGGVILASVMGAFTVHAIIGEQPSFTLPKIEGASWNIILLAPILAVVAALVGISFQRFTLWLRLKNRSFNFVPNWFKPVIGAWITWVLAIAVFWQCGHIGVFGLGYHDLSETISGQMLWNVAALLLVAKLFATSAAYGFGGCGGIFAPTLFFGGMTGACLAGLINYLGIPLTQNEIIALSIISMSACLAAVVHAPITSILIVFEMTHEFALVPGLMIGTLISHALGRSLNGENFYNVVLKQDGIDLDKVIPPRDLSGWQQHNVAAVANFNPITVESLDPDDLETLLARHKFTRFIVTEEGMLKGALNRLEVSMALEDKRPPKIVELPWCERHHSIREIQLKLIESPTGMIAVLDKPDGSVIGLLTLHDLIRAEQAIAARMDPA